MYKFSILLISCFYPVQGAPNELLPLSKDQSLRKTYSEYQDYIEIGTEDIDLNQFLAFLGGDEVSRQALFDYFCYKDYEIGELAVINVNLFMEYMEAVCVLLNKNTWVPYFANECLENYIKNHPKNDTTE